MQTKKMSLVNMQGKLSRNEMKNIMAGFVDEELDDEGDAKCIKKDKTCHQASGAACCSGLTCKDQGSEQGSKCKTT